MAGPEDPAPPSCTFTGAIVVGDTAYVGNVGDSRIYWLPDAGPGARQLSRDDSVAMALIGASSCFRPIAGRHLGLFSELPRAVSCRG